MEHSKDDIDVLNKTVLEKIVEGLRVIATEIRFIVSLIVLIINCSSLL